MSCCASLPAGIIISLNASAGRSLEGVGVLRLGGRKRTQAAVGFWESTDPFFLDVDFTILVVQ